MEIAVLSDIHGNYTALSRCLEYSFSRGISTFFLLGDYVAEIAYPKRTMEILYKLNREHNCYFLQGNKEEYWINYLSDGKEGWEDYNSTTGALLYTYKSLTDTDIAFYKQLPSAQKVFINTMPPILICHGSPYHVSEKMLPNDIRTNQIIDSVEASLMICGHTHVQQKILHNGKCVLNPGSVGLPLYSEGKTQFLILHGNNGIWAEEFLSLDYDVDKVINELYEDKLNEHAPYWSIITEYVLRYGTISHGNILLRAMELCKEVTGDCIWPHIPEEFWAQAVKDIIGH